MSSSKIKLQLILLILICSLTTIAAQSKLCTTCSKEIKTDYIVIDNKPFHTACFQCSFCNKQIAEEFNRHEGLYYHSKCYVENFLSKCDVCSKPLTGKYYVDVYDYKYHIEHEGHLDSCDNCNRLICENITKGSVKYGDGRIICNICYRNSANGQYEYDDLLEIALYELEELGLFIDSENVSIKSVDRNELKKVAGKNYVARLKGYTNTNIRTVDGEEMVRYTIYVLSMIPDEHIESVVSHELMHVWLHQNTLDNHNAELKEGFCNYISYIYMNTKTTDEAMNIVRLIEKNADPVYGDGFRKVRDKFHNSYLAQLLDFMKNNKNLY